MLRRHFLFLASAFPLVLQAGRTLGTDGTSIDPHRIVLLADTHIGRPAPKHSENLTRIVKEILAMDPRPAKVFILGDLAFSHGTLEEYREIKSLMAPLDEVGIPWHIVVGNHDTRETMFEIFPEKKMEIPGLEGKQIGIVEADGVDFLILDSRMDDTRAYMAEKAKYPNRQPWDGTMDARQQAWLEETLMNYPKPVFVMAHHPIRETKLAPVLSKYPAVQGYLYGHEHRYCRSQKENVELLLFPTASERIHGKKEPNGFVVLDVRENGFEFTLHALSPEHPLNGHSETVRKKVL